ncbi:MAG: hypothetical protein IAX21_00265 [Candidatus Bathyarchaeota archaeon]|nr:hypothetical protein [Candidatus Bathyarchaeum tardum]WGM90586.1 MAG: hypothetical protein NUK63_05540 [Candidatus Bathyarchaeum tardum]WNZ29341.1 MAG: hypothetical protein IAX21_00265 [Candidatus Bathyarchaeota archaeon]
MQRKNLLKTGVLATLLLVSSFATVVYALAYTEKHEVIYSNTITIDGQEVKFRAFYLSSPAAFFEVKLTVSEGTIKWTPHSAVMFDDTQGWFPCRLGNDTFGKIQRWVSETDNGTVSWRVDQENVDMVWYINLFNPDDYEKEVHIEIIKVWETQNYNEWM